MVSDRKKIKLRDYFYYVINGSLYSFYTNGSREFGIDHGADVANLNKPGHLITDLNENVNSDKYINEPGKTLKLNNKKYY